MQKNKTTKQKNHTNTTTKHTQDKFVKKAERGMPPLTRQRAVVRPELQMAAPSVEDEAWRRFTKGEEVAALRHRPPVSANSSIVPKNAQEHYPGESVG